EPSGPGRPAWPRRPDGDQRHAAIRTLSVAAERPRIRMPRTGARGNRPPLFDPDRPYQAGASRRSPARRQSRRRFALRPGRSGHRAGLHRPSPGAAPRHARLLGSTHRRLHRCTGACRHPLAQAANRKAKTRRLKQIGYPLWDPAIRVLFIACNFTYPRISSAEQLPMHARSFVLAAALVLLPAMAGAEVNASLAGQTVVTQIPGGEHRKEYARNGQLIYEVIEQDRGKGL